MGFLTGLLTDLFPLSGEINGNFDLTSGGDLSFNRD